MNIVGPKIPNNLPVIGKSNEPLMLTVQIIITPELKASLDQWQNETGIHSSTLGQIILTLGHLSLSRILHNENQRELLNAIAVSLAEANGPTEG